MAVTVFQQSKRHHYIPAFYLRRWCGSDGLLSEFSRPHVDLYARRCPPGSTGFQHQLYTLDNLGADRKAFLEDNFLRRVDQSASDALDALLSGNVSQLSIEILSGWSRFIISLHHRTPERLAALKQRAAAGLAQRLNEIEETYSEFRRENDPLTFAEARLLFDDEWSDMFIAQLFMKVVDSEDVMSHVNGMRWRILTLENTERTFLTSDNPVMRTNSIQQVGDHIAMPLSPKVLFVSVNDDAAFRQIESIPVNELVTKVNDHVCRSAAKFVFSTNESQKRFIGNRLRLNCDSKV